MLETKSGLRLASRASVAKQIFDTVEESSASTISAKVYPTVVRICVSNSIPAKEVITLVHFACKSFKAQ